MIIISNSAFIQSIQYQLRFKRNRGILVLIGECCWRSKCLHSFNLEAEKCSLICAEKAVDDPRYITPNKFKQFLGTEQTNIIFEVQQDFNVDAFAALSGTIKIGGLMILCLAPDVIAKSPFTQRFLERILPLDFVFQWQQTGQQESILDLAINKPSLAAKITPSSAVENVPSDFRYDCKTLEQQQAVEAVLKVVSGHRDRPLVLTADRGRGKSTALALACVELLQQPQKSLIITAPHPEALSIFFNQLKKYLPEAKHLKHKVQLGNSELRFIPLDKLLADKPACHLLMVDEAAGVPMPILKQLLLAYHRQVFVSTIHGYEGSGRGFSTKFIAELDNKRPNFRHLHVSEPIRWALNDPLELATFRGFLLNAQLQSPNLSRFDDLQYRVVSRKQLLTNEEWLEQIFALLVTAHYQTKPSDLKMLLDDENIHIIVQYQKEQILAVALLLSEGEVSTSLSDKVKQSLRRVKGHLTPQSLLVHNGIESAFEHKYMRIVRVAVQPKYQGKGLGSQLLTYSEKYVQNLGYDFTSSSFGANAELLNFWLANGYAITRLGFTKDAASGEHSALILKSLKQEKDEFVDSIEQTFYQDLLYFLADELKDIEPKLVSRIFQGQQQLFKSAINYQAINDFSQGYRLFSACAPELYRWFVRYLSEQTKTIENTAVDMLIRKLFQKHSWAQIATEYNTAGKKNTLNLLKTFVLTNAINHDLNDASLNPSIDHSNRCEK